MTSRPSVIGIIPARYGSVRLAAKPLIDLCGKPMIQHVHERASQSSYLDEVLVATDHEEIAGIVESFGGKAIMTPADLRSGTDRIAFVASQRADSDIIVNIQGDEPLIVPRMIDQAIEPLIADRTIQAGTLIREINSSGEVVNPNIVKVVVDLDGFALYFSRSPIPHVRDDQTMKQWHLYHTYYKHIGLYVYRRELLLQFAAWEESKLERAEKLEQLRMLEHGVKIKTRITTFDSIPVDTSEDAERVRAVLRTLSPTGKP
jgi:3-deoxy-manno-octulosonate cytidylyltransferase (CMP-KDO synthetase)